MESKQSTTSYDTSYPFKTASLPPNFPLMEIIKSKDS